MRKARYALWVCLNVAIVALLWVTDGLAGLADKVDDHE